MILCLVVRLVPVTSYCAFVKRPRSLKHTARVQSKNDLEIWKVFAEINLRPAQMPQRPAMKPPHNMKEHSGIKVTEKARASAATAPAIKIKPPVHFRLLPTKSYYSSRSTKHPPTRTHPHTKQLRKGTGGFPRGTRLMAIR